MSDGKGWRGLSEDAQHWAFWFGLAAVAVTAIAVGSVYAWWSRKPLAPTGTYAYESAPVINQRKSKKR